MFNDLQLKVMSEKSVLVAHKNLAKLGVFATSFSELDGKPGYSVAVPVYDLSAASAFDAESNNYCGGGNEIGGQLIALDQHLVKSVGITDVEQASTGIRWVGDTATAIAEVLTRGMNDYVFGLLADSAITLSADTPTTKTMVANLYATAEANDIPVNQAVVVLAPTAFASLLGQLDANVYGGSEAIRLGYIDGLYGFKAVVCASNLPDGVNGAIVADNAIGIASRYLFSGTDEAYPETWKATDEDSGVTIGYRRFANLCTGKNYLAGEILFGAKVMLPNKIVKLV